MRNISPKLKEKCENEGKTEKKIIINLKEVYPPPPYQITLVLVHMLYYALSAKEKVISEINSPSSLHPL